MVKIEAWGEDDEMTGRMILHYCRNWEHQTILIHRTNTPASNYPIVFLHELAHCYFDLGFSTYPYEAERVRMAAEKNWKLWRELEEWAVEIEAREFYRRYPRFTRRLLRELQQKTSCGC